jgi:GDP-L-fucose synthase
MDGNILLLGGTGFLGTALSEKLYEAGHRNDVIIVGRRHLSRSEMPPTFVSISCDLSDEQEINKLYKYAKPVKCVVNMAAFVGGIGLNRENPGRMFHDNMRISFFCTHQAYKCDVQKYIYIGTVCAYPKFTPVPFKEEDIWNGYPEETNAPYGIVKKSISVMMDGYRRQYGFNGVFLIPVNMYGPRDNFDPNSSHVIPALIKKVMAAKENNEDLVVWGDGSATREFLYVYDCADAIVKAINNYNGSELINIGSGNETSIKDLTNILADIVGYHGVIKWDASKPNGQPRRCLDTSKAKKLLGFEASTSLKDGLLKTVGWYANHR